MREKLKTVFSTRYTILAGVSLVLILGILIFGLTHKYERAAEVLRPGETEDSYYLDERTVAEFSKVIVEKFREESELTVLTADASIDVDLKKIGLFNWSVLNKAQTIRYKGSGRFYVDLSALSAKNVLLDNNVYTITIEIPHAKMAPVEIDPDKFEAEEVEKGFFAFGDLKFTPAEFNLLEKEAKARITKEVDTKDNRAAADARAIEEMKKIYDPIVRLVDASYRVEIVFVE